MKKWKIVVITTEYLHPFLQKAFGSMELEAEMQIVEYTNFKNIADIYYTEAEEADGFIVSGSGAYRALLLHIGEAEKPIRYFDTDSTGIYRALLEQMVQNRSLRLDRVLISVDALPFEQLTCDYMLDEDRVYHNEQSIRQWMSSLTLEELTCYEEKMVEKLIRLWEEQKMDLVICQFTSILRTLQQAGVPCIYAYPSKQSLEQVIKRLVQEMQQREAKKNLPAIISVGLIGVPGSEKLRVEVERLETELSKLNQKYGGDLIIQKEAAGCDIYTKYAIAAYMTEQFRHCALSRYLKEQLPFAVCIGYGAGATISDAKANATKAKREAFQQRGGSFAIDEQQRLYGPMSSENNMIVEIEVTPQVQEMAHRSQLSTMTIQKLMAMVAMSGNSQVTAQDIAGRFQVTPRNANRILTNLEKGGLAQVVGRQAAQTKGRPTKVYQLHLK